MWHCLALALHIISLLCQSGSVGVKIVFSVLFFFRIGDVSTVWLFKVNKRGIEYFQRGPKLNEARKQLACGIFNSEKHDGNPVIVVAGRFASKTSEFWDFTTQGSKWELGNLSFCLDS